MSSAQLGMIVCPSSRHRNVTGAGAHWTHTGATAPASRADRLPLYHGNAKPSFSLRGTMCRCRCHTDWVASRPALVMTLHGACASSAAARIATADTAGSSVTSRTCAVGMTSTWPSTTGLRGTIAIASGHRRMTVAGDAPAMMSQNTQGLDGGRTLTGMTTPPAEPSAGIYDWTPADLADRVRQPDPESAAEVIRALAARIARDADRVTDPRSLLVDLGCALESLHAATETIILNACEDSPELRAEISAGQEHMMGAAGYIAGIADGWI